METCNNMERRFSKRNIVLVCAILINLQLGMSYSWSVFSNALISDYGWTSADAVLPATVMAVAYSISMLLFGFFQEKYGPRMTIRIGALLMGGGLIVSGQFMTVPGIVIGYGVMHGCGVGACFSTTSATTLKWIPVEKQGRVTGIIQSAYGISSVLMAVIAEMLIKKGGIDLALNGIGAAIIILAFTAGSFFSLPEGYKVGKDNGKENAISEPSDDLNCMQMVKTKAFYLILGAYIFSSAAALTPINHISMITSLQGNLATGYVFVSIMSIFNCVGRFAGGYLADKFNEKKVLLTIGIINLINMILFGSYEGPVAFVIGCIIDGTHVGMIMALTPLLISRHFGKKYCAQNYGLIACCGFVNGFLGSQLAGVLVDMYGTYNYTYIICSGYLILSTLLIWCLPKSKM